jgi:hypothetical protein
MNFWQRLGIVCSVIWILGGGFWELSDRSNAAVKAAELSYDICTDTKRGSEHPELCSNEMSKTLVIWRDGIWGDVAIFAFGPIPLAWLLVYFSLWVVRWVMAGRKSSTPRHH